MNSCRSGPCAVALKNAGAEASVPSASPRPSTVIAPNGQRESSPKPASCDIVERHCPLLAESGTSIEVRGSSCHVNGPLPPAGTAYTSVTARSSPESSFTVTSKSVAPSSIGVFLTSSFMFSAQPPSGMDMNPRGVFASRTMKPGFVSFMLFPMSMTLASYSQNLDPRNCFILGSRK